MIKKYNNTILSLNINLKHKKLKFHIKLTNYGILEKLCQLNLIKFFEKTPSGVTVYVNTRLSNIITIHQYNRTNSKIYLSKNQILKKKLNIGATIYLLSTPRGVLTQHEADRKSVV